MPCEHNKTQRLRTTSGRWVKLCETPQCWPAALEPVPKPPPPPAPEPPRQGLKLFRTVRSGDYNTQGLGAANYARRKAEMITDELQHAGFDSEMVKSNSQVIKGHDFHGRPWSVVHEDFQVWSTADASLKLADGWTIKEWVRQCWKRGVNPRVYMHSLPHGFEEQHGLDYFGGEVKK